MTVFVVSSATSPAMASGGAAMPIYMTISQYSPASTTLLLNVEGSDSIENVKQKVDDVTYLVPSEMCLVYSGTFLQEGDVLDDHSIEEGDSLDLFTLPVTSAWSITPDEPYLGGTVSNAIITHPSVTHAEVVAGKLPAGVTLNEVTGQVEGTFTQPGAFEVTIAVDTLCGSSELAWSGTVPGTLANTGRNAEFVAVSLGLGALTFIAGLVMTAVRWRRKVPRALD
jgi:hypothetical protein